MTVVRARPRRLRTVAWLCAVACVGFFGVIAVLLGATSEGQATFRLGDQIGMAALGVLLGLGLRSLTRPRIEADAAGVRVRNIVGGYTLPWGVVRAVRFDRHASWASLELMDDELVAVLAIQATDKEYAVAAVRGLRELLAASRADD